MICTYVLLRTVIHSTNPCSLVAECLISLGAGMKFASHMRYLITSQFLRDYKKLQVFQPVFMNTGSVVCNVSCLMIPR